MKLINYLTLRFAFFFTAIVFLWSAIYLFLQMKEIHDGNDEGLSNLKQEFIAKSNRLPGFVEDMERDAPLNLIISEITLEEAENIIEDFSTTQVYFSTELEDEEVRMLTSAFYCTQNGKYYRIQFFTSTVETNDLIKNIFYLLLGLWAAVIVTLLIISKIIILRTNRPFNALLSSLKKFSLNNSSMIDLPETKIHEYRQLNQSVKELLEKNISIYNEQKHFIENTSHELQTPVAIALAKLEMLLERNQNNETLYREISSIMKTLNRMKRLNTNLLLLSKIRHRQFPETVRVNLRETLETIIADFEDIIAHKNITLTSDGDKQPYFQMNTDMAQIMLTNLLKNAITHNKPRGEIQIRYFTDGITIANSGSIPLVSPFERYQTATPDTKSSGLGLSIVKSIADIYGLNIKYIHNGMHVFEVKTAFDSKIVADDI